MELLKFILKLLISFIQGNKKEIKKEKKLIQNSSKSSLDILEYYFPTKTFLTSFKEHLVNLNTIQKIKKISL